MISLLTTIINDLFQDRTKRLIGLLTLFLCLGIPVLLSRLEIPKQVPSTLLPLLVYLSTIMLLIILGLFALFITTFIKDGSSVVKETKLKDLSQFAVDILAFFGQQEYDDWLTPEQLCAAFEKTSNQTQVAIDQLVHYEFLDHMGDPYFEDLSYSLSLNGRAFLDKHKLL